MVYSDSDWAGDSADAKSTTGTVTLLSHAAVEWRSKKQTTVALSSSEAEYVASAEAARDIVWLRRFLAHVGCAQPLPTTLFIDNTCTIGMANNDGVHHARRKHINVKHHFIRQCIRVDKTIKTHWIETSKNVADIFTKPLPARRFQALRDVIMGYKHTIPAMM